MIDLLVIGLCLFTASVMGWQAAWMYKDICRMKRLGF